MSGSVPRFSGRPRKNDGLFMFGATQQLPFVYTYCQTETQVIHGPSCKRDTEIDTEQCRADGVEVVERRGGGGTVVLSSGMVVTLVVDERGNGGAIKDIFSRVHRPMIELLSPLVAAAIEESGISDLAIGGRKILGSSLYLPRRPDLYFYQSSLIVDSDLNLIPRYLRHPPREPDYRKGRNHADFCTTLKNEGCDLSTENIARLFADKLPGLILARR